MGYKIVDTTTIVELIKVNVFQINEEFIQTEWRVFGVLPKEDEQRLMV